MPRQGSRAALPPNGNAEINPPATPYRKEKLSRSKQELAQEAAKVLDQVDSVDCFSQGYGKRYTKPKKKIQPNAKKAK